MELGPRALIEQFVFEEMVSFCIVIYATGDEMDLVHQFEMQREEIEGTATRVLPILASPWEIMTMNGWSQSSHWMSFLILTNTLDAANRKIRNQVQLGDIEEEFFLG